MAVPTTDRLTIHVLLVEDNPADARLVQEALKDTTAGVGFRVSHATTLHAALAFLEGERPDVVLLDLGLPDCERDETYPRLREVEVSVPTVVLSGLDDEAEAAETVRHGAQDFLAKSRLDGELLSRSLRYAIERGAAQREHDLRVAADARRAAAEAALQEALRELERETAALGRLTAGGAVAPSVTAESYGVVPLRHALPAVFAELVDDYARTLDLALEQRAFRVEHQTTAHLKRLADRLGFLRGGPRDAVDLHVEALRQKTEGAPEGRARAYFEEGRLAVLELMGNLVSYYRRACVSGAT